MKRICAWCNKFMGEVRLSDDTDGLITHSICDECADNLEFQLGVTLQRYLDSLKIPIVLVDVEGNTLLANAAVHDSPAPPCQLPDEWPGKIYECAHARLPERCNNDVHCSGCTIRFAVNETYATGREIVAAPALLTGSTSDPAQNHDYLISTKLVHGTVHLRIEKL